MRPIRMKKATGMSGKPEIQYFRRTTKTVEEVIRMNNVKTAKLFVSGMTTRMMTRTRTRTRTGTMSRTRTRTGMMSRRTRRMASRMRMARKKAMKRN